MMPKLSHLIVSLACVASLAFLSPTPAGAQLSRIQTRLAGQRCLVVQNASQSLGARLFLYDCNGTANEYFNPLANGELRLYNGSVCVGVSGAGNSGDAIVLAACNGAPSTRWSWVNGTLKNIGNGRCMDVANGLTANGSWVLLWDCHGATNQLWTSSSTLISTLRPRIKKLYAFDGTNSRDVHHNSLYHVYERWVGPKFWLNGPNLLATDIDPIYDAAYTQVCNDIARGEVDEVFVMGYSRGAMIAVKVANNVRTNCGARVQFVGLIEAVNSTIYNWPTRVNAGIGLGVHLRKQDVLEGVLTTRDIDGVWRYLSPYNVNHQTMVCDNRLPGTIGNLAWKWTRDQMVTYAKQAGGAFEPQTRESTDC